MSGFGGLKKPRKQRQEAIGLKERAQSLWKECEGLVVGWDAVIGSKWLAPLANGHAWTFASLLIN